MMPVGTAGGGIEYFLSDTVAVGVEVTVPVRRHPGRPDRRRIALELDRLALRVVRTAAVLPRAPDGARSSCKTVLRRLYRPATGSAIVTDPRVSSELEARPEPPAIGPLNQYFGGAEIRFRALPRRRSHLRGYVETTLGVEGRRKHRRVRGLRRRAPQARLRYPCSTGGSSPTSWPASGWPAPRSMTASRRARGADPGVGLRSRGDGRRRTRVSADPEHRSGAGDKIPLHARAHAQARRGATHEANLGPVFVSLGLRVYLADF